MEVYIYLEVIKKKSKVTYKVMMDYYKYQPFFKEMKHGWLIGNLTNQYKC